VVAAHVSEDGMSTAAAGLVELDAQPLRTASRRRTPALVIIDMQRDFIEPAASAIAGQRRAPARGDRAGLPRGARQPGAIGGLVVHTREAHRADLSDCPPASATAAIPTLRIGDSGPMGRILVAGEPGNQIIPALAPAAARS
jgi:nicotinamidase-related amidase